MKKSILPIMVSVLFMVFTACEKDVLEERQSAATSDPEVTDSKKKPGGGKGSRIRSYLTGDATDVQAATVGGTVLMGGGTDVDAAIQWMVDRAGGGDFVVIRASGSDGYNDYIYNMGNVNSVETLLIRSRRDANSAEVEQKIRNAEAIFIAGGDQADYVNYWKDTYLEDAFNYVRNVKKIPVGGTSAGLAVLGQFYYAAFNGTVYSSEALEDPYNTYMAGLGKDFFNIPYLANTITDSHYSDRDRHGRHFTFMARLVKDFSVDYRNVRGIGVDEKTAACVDENGIAHVYGAGSVYFIKGHGGTPEVCVSGTPLTWNRGGQAMATYRVPGTSSGKNTFSLADWSTGSGGSWTYWWANNGNFQY